MRRVTSSGEPVIRVGDLVVDLEKRSASVNGDRVQLTPNEFKLLAVLARNLGKLLTHTALLREVWGPEYGTETNYLRVYMAHIRRKLEPNPSEPRYFITEPGMGYRFESGDPAD
jgi:two-component system KDP operon response regulator KdpE